MRILYIIPDWLPKESGFTIAFRSFLKSLLVSLGRQDVVTVVHPSQEYYSSVNEYDDRVKFIYSKLFVRYEVLGKKTPYFKKALEPVLRSLVKRRMGQCDVIIIESLFLSESVALLRPIVNNKLTLRVHGSLLEQLSANGDRKELKRILRNIATVGRLSTTTPFYVSYIRRLFSSNGIGCLSEFSIVVNSASNNAIKHSDGKSNKLNLLQLGRQDKNGFFQKGFYDTFIALQYLERNLGQDSSVYSLRIVGSGENEGEVQKLAKALKYIEVELISKAKNAEVLQYIVQADCVLLPSRFEGMSMFVTEALLLGAKVITSLGQGSEFYVNYCNGLAIDTMNPWLYMNALTGLSRHTESDRALIKNKAEQIFGEKIQEDQLSKLILSLNAR